MKGILAVLLVGWFLPCVLGTTSYGKEKGESKSAEKESESASATSTEVDVEGGDSIFVRSWQGGFVVFFVLLTLVILSILAWGIGIAKLLYLRGLDKEAQGFVKSFWDSRSLNDLNAKLGDYAYSPVREVFRSGYAELVRGSQLRESAGAPSALLVQAAVDNLTRALGKSKTAEKRRLESYLSFLSITASAAPFIGLFGTVWGIMNAFEGIARTGSASLATVAPGISEALIATAFGLAAAIPAVVAYNICAHRIRAQLGVIDGFIADFLNIVERYMVSDRQRGKEQGPTAQTVSTAQ